MPKRTAKHRFSFLISPLSYLTDLTILFLVYRLMFHGHVDWLMLFLLVAGWSIISVAVKYYEIPRTLTLNELLAKYFNQIFIFNLYFLALLAVFHIFYHNKDLLIYLGMFDLLVLLKNIFLFIAIKKYRERGYNLRNYVIFGYNEELAQFKQLLDRRKDFGYRFLGFFSDANFGKYPEVIGTFDDGLQYVKDNAQDVNVIFSSLRYKDAQLNQLIDLSEDCFKQLKFLPDNKELFKNKLNLEFFEYYPVLHVAKSPLDKPLNAFIKRAFDIVFSSCMILCVLSWLTPILAIAIKLESKGPVFFKQLRNGEFYKPFYLYKFRSMRPNRLADIQQVSKDDNRITKLGKFLRKSSIDELPQFFNVLKGDMSIVGPRPHMIKENERFQQRVGKFLPRHQVKPGITGLAQVKGYRGEVKTDEDIINRVKYDIHYIKNWSFLLDIKIIFQTVYNMIRGDKKAY